MDSKKPRLRIHREDAPAATCHTAKDVLKSNVASDEVAACLEAFTRATGWAVQSTKQKRVAKVDSLASVSLKQVGGSRVSDAPSNRWRLVDAMTMDGVMDFASTDIDSIVSQQTADHLLGAIERIVARLEQAEDAIRGQQAALATDVQIVRNRDEQVEIADRLESVLESSGRSIRATAAAIYLLDEDTSELKLRASWMLPLDRLLQPARPLRGSLADLEALMGNAVLLDDLSEMTAWESPEVFASALVVPIGSVAMPHGTLWYWSDETRKYDPAQVEIANLASGRVMNELEQSVLGSQLQQTRRESAMLDRASVAQAGRQPDDMPLHKNFEIAGWSFQDHNLGGAFHDWDLTAKSQIVAAFGNADANGPQGAIVASAIAAMARQTWVGNIAPNHGMQAIGDYLFAGGPEDWSAHATLLSIDPLTGRGCLCAAGNNQAIIISPLGFRPLGFATAALATDPTVAFRLEKFVLQPGEVLVGLSDSLVRQLNLPSALKQQSSFNPFAASSKEPMGRNASAANMLRRHRRTLARSLDQHELLADIRRMMDDSADDIAQQIARRLPVLHHREGDGLDRSLLVIRNHTKPF